MSLTRNLLEKIQEASPLPYYGAGLILGAGLTLLFYLFFGPMWMLKFPFWLGISLAVARFVAGFGILLIWATASIYLLKKFSPWFKGKKKKAEQFLTFLNVGAIILFLVVVGWQLSKLRLLFLGNTSNEGSSFFSYAASGGIVYFMIGTYILPVWREVPLKEEKEGTLKKIKGHFGKLTRKIKKGYWKYLRQDFLKAHLKEYVVFRGRFDEYRRKLTWIMLLPLAIGLLIFPFLSVPVVFLWMKKGISRETWQEYMTIEKALLVVFLCTSTAWLFILLAPFFPYSFSSYLHILLWTIPYIGGASIAFYLFSRSTMWDFT